MQRPGMAGMGFVTIVILSGWLVQGGSPCDASGVTLSKGATVYVPAYSCIQIGRRGQPFELAISLTVRNTDPVRPITVLSVDYYDSRGKLVKQYGERPVQLAPLASVDYFVRDSDLVGDVGAGATCFIVKWESSSGVNEPLVETVMVGTKFGQGVSFSARGQVIKDERHYTPAR